LWNGQSMQFVMVSFAVVMDALYQESRR
jgi:hypothetical protein